MILCTQSEKEDRREIKYSYFTITYFGSAFAVVCTKFSKVNGDHGLWPVLNIQLAYGLTRKQQSYHKPACRMHDMFRTIRLFSG